MLQVVDSKINPATVSAEEWNALIKDEHFSVLRAYISTRVEMYRSKMEEAQRVLSQDTLIKIGSYLSKIEELKHLLVIADRKGIQAAELLRQQSSE